MARRPAKPARVHPDTIRYGIVQSIVVPKAHHRTKGSASKAAGVAQSRVPGWTVPRADVKANTFRFRISDPALFSEYVSYQRPDSKATGVVVTRARLKPALRTRTLTLRTVKPIQRASARARLTRVAVYRGKGLELQVLVSPKEVARLPKESKPEALRVQFAGTRIRAVVPRGRIGSTKSGSAKTGSAKAVTKKSGTARHTRRNPTSTSHLDALLRQLKRQGSR